MTRPLLAPFRKIVRRLGFDVVRYPIPEARPPDLREPIRTIIGDARQYTLTTFHRLASMWDAIRYIHEAKVPGAIVECGVWRGGNMYLAARALQHLGDTSRELFLYDTFEGMTPPTSSDVDYLGNDAGDMLATEERGSGIWCEAGIDDVKLVMASTGYPPERIHLVKGRVEETIPAVAADEIAVLRLDTDWYESTKHEMTHLFPRLSRRGVLIVDDYGHWQGARKALDEYLAEHRISGMLARVDYTCRIMIKDQ